MKFINFIIKIFDKLINIAVTLFLLFILFIGLYAIYDYYYITHDGTLSKEIINLQGNKKEEPITLDKLKEINSDIIGWIKIDDTVVDYPILIGDDNNEYLYADYNKKYAVTGSIFMDYRNKDTFVDEYSIIYGHNMQSGQMFGSFLKYANKDYLLKHNKGTITADKTYDIEIIGYTIKSAYDEIYDLKMNKNELYEYYKKDAIVFIDKPIDNENLLILSTCDSTNRNDRRILLVKYSEKIEEEVKEEVVPETKIENKSENKSNTNLFIMIGIIFLLIIFIIYMIIKLLLNKKVNQSNETIDNEVESL